MGSSRPHPQGAVFTCAGWREAAQQAGDPVAQDPAPGLPLSSPGKSQSSGGVELVFKSLSWYFQLNISFLDTSCLAGGERGHRPAIYLLVVFGEGTWISFRGSFFRLCYGGNVMFIMCLVQYNR